METLWLHVHFAFAGTRLALKCGSDSTYFSLIHECVPLSIAALPSFVLSFSNSVACNGTTVRTSKDLEGLRYCIVVNGELDIILGDLTADYSVLTDIVSITGLSLLECLWHYFNECMSRSVADCQQQHLNLELVCSSVACQRAEHHQKGCWISI